ncbi:MAG TPA: autotransporter-associated beta strand repeat-containing protein, partial [Candidatus Anammoximicrobium sp.]|nr:autotransporter-associated beta strand repeat-containing protein [Candidatus Anammoximicrobium sp.]
NSYSGDTTVSAGTLQLGADEVLPDGAGAGNVIVNGTLDLNGFTETVNNLTGSGNVIRAGDYLQPTFFTTNADSGISTSKTYTHLLDFGNNTGATVNGVAFSSSGLSGTNFFMTGATSLYGEVAPGSPTFGDAPDGTAMNQLFSDFYYNGNPARLVLRGLTAGVTYETRLYNRSYGGTRVQNIMFDEDGNGPLSRLVTFDEDFSTTANYIAYRFTAMPDPSGGAYPLTIRMTAAGGSGTYHFYGATNEVAPAALSTSTLTINESLDTTFSGQIGGGVNVVKQGAATLTLTSPQTYAGSTSILDGTIKLGTAPTAPTVVNPSFEAPVLSTNSYIYYTSMSAEQKAALVWTGGPVLENGNSAWGYTTPKPDGAQAVSLQMTSTVSQTLNFTSPGYYTLSWYAERRGGQINPTDVRLDGVTVYNFVAPSGSVWTRFSTVLAVPTAGNHTITFAGLNPGGGDNSVGIDNISLVGTPGQLPASTTVSIAGQSTDGGAYGTLDLNGTQQTVAGISSGGISGTGTAYGTITNSGGADAMLAVTGTSQYDGVITDGATNKTALSKSAGGMLTLTGASSYSGGTTIAGGTLQMNHADAVGTAGLIIGNGARLSLNHSGTTSNAIQLVGAAQTIHVGDLAAISVGFRTPTLTGDVTTDGSAGTLAIDSYGRQDGSHNLTFSGNTISLGGKSLVINGHAAGGNVDSIAEANNEKTTFANVTFDTTGNVSVGRGSLQVQGDSNVTVGGQLLAGTAWQNVILQDAAAVTVTGGVDFRNVASNLALDGGTLTTPWIWGNRTFGGASRTIFNGTRVVASADSPDFLRMSLDFDKGAHSAPAEIANGGAIFDTNGHDITLANILTNLPGHSGPLTKSGAGTLTLTSLNGYSGATTVSGGMLRVNGSIANSAVTVQTGGALGGTGTTGPLTVDSGGLQTPGNSPGITTVTGDYVENGALEIEFLDAAGGPGVGYDQVQVVGGGSVTLGATSTIVAPLTFLGVAGTFAPAPAQVFTIIDNDGTGPGDLSGTFWNAAPGSSFTVDNKTLKMFYNAGDGNDVVLVFAGGTPSVLYINDQWTAPGMVDGDLETPAVENAYVGIDAFESLAAALAAYPSYAGPIVVNGGTYASADLASGAITLRLVRDLASGQDDVTLASLSGSADDAIVTRYHDVSGANLIVESGSFGGLISGAGSLTKTTGGQLAISNANTYGGGTTVSGGRILLQNAGGLGAGDVTIADGPYVMLWWNTGSSTVPNNFFLNGLGATQGGEQKDTIYGNGGGAGYGEYVLSGTITLNATSNIGGNNINHVRITGQVTGPGGLTKGGTRADENNTLILTNPANDYQGPTTVTKGRLQLGADEVLPHGMAAGSVTVEAGATLDLGAYDETINGLSGTGTVTRSGAYSTGADGAAQISTSKNYVQLLDFGNGSGATVNGVAFANAGTSSTGWSLVAPNLYGESGSPTGYDQLVSDFYYNGNPGTLTFSNLTVGTTYEAVLYTKVGHWAGRPQNATFDEDGGGPISNQLRRTDPGTVGYYAYRFVAPSPSATISMAPQTAGTFHWFAASLETVTAATHTLTVGDANSYQFNGVISGPTAIIKQGSGHWGLGG